MSNGIKDLASRADTALDKAIELFRFVSGTSCRTESCYKRRFRMSLI